MVDPSIEEQIAAKGPAQMKPLRYEDLPFAQRMERMAELCLGQAAACAGSAESFGPDFELPRKRRQIKHKLEREAKAWSEAAATLRAHAVVIAASKRVTDAALDACRKAAAREDALVAEIEALRADVIAASDRATAAEAERDRAREVLEFYADPFAWNRQQPDPLNRRTVPDFYDELQFGDRAEAFLRSTPAPVKEGA